MMMRTYESSTTSMTEFLVRLEEIFDLNLLPFERARYLHQRVTCNRSFVNGGEVLTAVLDSAITETTSAA